MTARSEEDDMDSGPAYIVNALGVAVNLFLKPPRQDNITNFKNKFYSKATSCTPYKGETNSGTTAANTPVKLGA
jgi:hypothetical protein